MKEVLFELYSYYFIIYLVFILGMMPMQNFSSFKSMTTFCRTKVPQKIWDDILPIQGDDEAVKAYGIKLCADMCRVLQAAGVRGFHYYTLNLESSVMSVLKQLGIEGQDALKRYGFTVCVGYVCICVCICIYAMHVSPHLSNTTPTPPLTTTDHTAHRLRAGRSPGRAPAPT
jgi:hypothetical protein